MVCPQCSAAVRAIVESTFISIGSIVKTSTTIPMPVPAVPASINVDTTVGGHPIQPIERIKLFDDQQWEEFIHEWVHSLKDDYESVERCSGAGDMGRDIVAICAGGRSGWDNYQCKHYDHRLTPSDIWIELGKLIYYTFQGNYTVPRRYVFVAPQGVGTKLSNLLRDPEKLRSELFSNWNSKCRENITSTATIELDGALKAHAEALDFSIFCAASPITIIEQHAKTRWHTIRFGGGLPPRPPVSLPPAEPTENEARYVRQLLDAYGDHLGCTLSGLLDLEDRPILQDHFKDSRREFYAAEALRTFSRDTLPFGEFEKLQEEIHSGVKDEIRSNHSDGYHRVVATTKMARLLPITAHPLSNRMTIWDRAGICHQLANDDEITWVV